MENKTLVFDMDGTISDTYGVETWQEDLANQNTRPYTDAKPMYNMKKLNKVLEVLKHLGWKIVVTTWLSKETTDEYDKAVTKAKLDWLAKYDFPYDDIHIVKYGTKKSDCTKNDGGYQILIDDNENVRNEWNLGRTIDASKNIAFDLFNILFDDMEINEK